MNDWNIDATLDLGDAADIAGRDDIGPQFLDVPGLASQKLFAKTVQEPYESRIQRLFSPRTTHTYLHPE